MLVHKCIAQSDREMLLLEPCFLEGGDAVGEDGSIAPHQQHRELGEGFSDLIVLLSLSVSGLLIIMLALRDAIW